MSLTSFSNLPGTARLWVFNAERALSEDQLRTFRTMLERFLGEWAAHGSPLTVGYEIRHDQFVLVGVDDSLVGPSGCSIDALTNFLRAAGSQLGLDFLDAPEVCYWSADKVECVSRLKFIGLVDRGEVDGTTVVFDKTVSSVDAARNGRLEVPAGEAWHARAFDFRSPVIVENRG